VSSGKKPAKSEKLNPRFVRILFLQKTAKLEKTGTSSLFVYKNEDSSFYHLVKNNDFSFCRFCHFLPVLTVFFTVPAKVLFAMAESEPWIAAS